MNIRWSLPLLRLGLRSILIEIDTLLRINGPPLRRSWLPLLLPLFLLHLFLLINRSFFLQLFKNTATIEFKRERKNRILFEKKPNCNCQSLNEYLLFLFFIWIRYHDINIHSPILIIFKFDQLKYFHEIVYHSIKFHASAHYLFQMNNTGSWTIWFFKLAELEFELLKEIHHVHIVH